MASARLVNLCIPVLRRYDLLRECLLSANPDKVWIIDNGRDIEKLYAALAGVWPFAIHIHEPPFNLGVAASWNWFINHVPEERIICNDDILFASESLTQIVNTPGLFVTALLGTNAFSCFLIRDECVTKVGQFDETISPGYAYFEDVDYAWRMEAQRIPLTPVECGVRHEGSASLVWDDEHNRKFLIARENFKKKWGRSAPEKP